MLNWLVLRFEGHDHLAGMCLETITVRVTSPIRSYDRGSRSITTTSGRRYLLQGRPQASIEVVQGLSALLRSFGLRIEDATDVTSEYLDESPAA